MRKTRQPSRNIESSSSSSLEVVPPRPLVLPPAPPAPPPMPAAAPAACASAAAAPMAAFGTKCSRSRLLEYRGCCVAAATQESHSTGTPQCLAYRSFFEGGSRRGRSLEGGGGSRSGGAGAAAAACFFVVVAAAAAATAAVAAAASSSAAAAVVPRPRTTTRCVHLLVRSAE